MICQRLDFWIHFLIGLGETFIIEIFWLHRFLNLFTNSKNGHLMNIWYYKLLTLVKGPWVFAGVLTSIIKGYGYYFVYKVAKEKYLKPWDIHEHNQSTRTSYFSNSTYMFFCKQPRYYFPISHIVHTYMTNHLLMVILI